MGRAFHMLFLVLICCPLLEHLNPDVLTFSALIAAVVITAPNCSSFGFTVPLCFPHTEEAAGAWGHDGPFILSAEAHPEDQQVQPLAAGHAVSCWLLQAKRHDPGYTARI